MVDTPINEELQLFSLNAINSSHPSIADTDVPCSVNPSHISTHPHTVQKMPTTPTSPTATHNQFTPLQGRFWHDDEHGDPIPSAEAIADEQLAIAIPEDRIQFVEDNDSSILGQKTSIKLQANKFLVDQESSSKSTAKSSPSPVTSGSLYSPSMSKAKQTKLKKAAKRKANELARKQAAITIHQPTEDAYAEKLYSDLKTKRATANEASSESQASSNSTSSNSQSVSLRNSLSPSL